MEGEEPNTPRLGARRRRGEGGLAYLSLHACESCVVSNSLARMHMDMLACSLLQGKLRRIRLPPCGCGLGCGCWDLELVRGNPTHDLSRADAKINST